MLRIEHLRKDYGGQRVLDDTSLALKPGERGALVAPNGAGKSTLLKIVAGLEEPDGGRVLLPSGLVVGYLSQDAGVQPGRTLHDEVLSAVSDLLAIEDTLRSLEQEMSSATADQLEALVARHAELQEEFERRGGYAIEAEIGRVLAGLGFSEEDRGRQTQEFSGGWQMRIALARLLLGRPDILLLDEPTNHLDLAATEWLEDYVKASRATLLIVSHDRYFLDAVIQRVFELRDGRIETFPPGNYSAYRLERTRRDEAQQDIAQRQQEEIERVEAYIRRYKEGNRATMAKSREKMLARLEAQRVTLARPDRVVKFAFPACPPSGREVVLLSHVNRAYGERLVLQDVNLVIERGERVALIGPNGAGKSTLLRLLAGRDRPSRGSATLGVGVRAAYFAQDQAEHLDPANTAFDEVYQAAPASWDIQAVRDLLGRFLFHGDAQFKSVATLSGGERSRVALAKLLLRPNNLLLLDEPTNHLDIATRERLEDTLSAYTGTLIVATHDRYLVNQLATRVIEVADGGVKVYTGTYADYQRAKAATVSVPASTTVSPERAANGTGAGARAGTPGGSAGSAPRASNGSTPGPSRARNGAAASAGRGRNGTPGTGPQTTNGAAAGSLDTGNGTPASSPRAGNGTAAGPPRASNGTAGSAPRGEPPRANGRANDGDPAARRRLAADLREAERAVTIAEERLKGIEAQLSDPASYSGDLADLAREHAALLAQIETLTARWADLAEAAEGAA